ncbi:MAG: peptide chain release factor N(5)-glutamine methyltransferase, partial [Deltaproteobacteria bacterium]
MVQRRLSGEPLQYLLGHQEFWSIDLQVDPRVLIPRPDTELLVEQALSVLSNMDLEKALIILEIGTGSGAISIALAREVRGSFLVATDLSREGIHLARFNARQAGVSGKIAFVVGDLFRPFHHREEKGVFDLIVSNPPYIVRSEIERLDREVKDFEPTLALDGGEDGLDFHRKILFESPMYLRQGGWLLLEVGQGQAEAVCGIMEE